MTQLRMCDECGEMHDAVLVGCTNSDEPVRLYNEHGIPRTGVMNSVPLVGPDYRATPEGMSVKMRWDRLVSEFLEGIPEEARLSDIPYLCDGELPLQITRRIVLERRK